MVTKLLTKNFHQHSCRRLKRRFHCSKGRSRSSYGRVPFQIQPRRLFSGQVLKYCFFRLDFKRNLQSLNEQYLTMQSDSCRNQLGVTFEFQSIEVICQNLSENGHLLFDDLIRVISKFSPKFGNSIFLLILRCDQLRHGVPAKTQT